MAETEGLCVISNERRGFGLQQLEKPIHTARNEEDLQLIYYWLDPAWL
jgi:hypothetical protein